MEAAARQSRPRRADLEARADGQLGSSVRSLAPNGSRDSVGRPVRPPGKIRAEKSVRLRSVRSGADYRDGVRWAILACAKVVPSRRSARSSRKSARSRQTKPRLSSAGPLLGIELRGEERPFLIEVAEARPGAGGEKPADHPLESGDGARHVLRPRTLARPETHGLPGFVPGDEINLDRFAAHPPIGSSSRVPGPSSGSPNIPDARPPRWRPARTVRRRTPSSVCSRRRSLPWVVRRAAVCWGAGGAIGVRRRGGWPKMGGPEVRDRWKCRP